MTDRINDRISQLDKDILDEINKNKYISGAELSELLSKSVQTVQRHLSSLTKKGYIRRTGSKKLGIGKFLESKLSLSLRQRRNTWVLCMRDKLFLCSLPLEHFKRITYITVPKRRQASFWEQGDHICCSIMVC